MENTVNFGIDLGTTNSVIARFVKGNVEIFKNPIDWKDTLPSVVGFRKDKIFVGSKAKEYAEKDPKAIAGVFKRKMGTTETLTIKSIGQIKTPIELSAYILKELKTFVHTGEEVEAAVITIPASFDTIQSNATKEAGFQAGFKQVELLQEPIAASLAYVNKTKVADLSNGQWLVYDLGGGTFDVALIKIQDGEMKVLYHEGNNFLGGADFDDRIVEKIIVPYLNENHAAIDFHEDLRSAAGKYNAWYYKFLHLAETAKIELSSKTSTDIEFELEDGDFVHDVSLTLTRSEFESLVKHYIDDTAEMVKKILTRKALRANDIQFILMVGGSTHIPYVRTRIEELLQIPLNRDIEPTTAVGIGAAFYAGTKEKKKQQAENKVQSQISIKAVYEKVSREDEELFSVKVIGETTNLYYRIKREDGGFDLGLKTLSSRFSEDLPLVKDSYNYFTFSVYDEQNNKIETDFSTIGIAHGKYTVAGQPLPNDICLEVDDLDNNKTKLEPIFAKNSILPLKKNITKTASSKVRWQTEESLHINIVEGSHYNTPESNQTIGFLRISGNQLTRDLVKSADVELTLEMSESRDLTVSAYIPMTDQTFTETFNPKQRVVDVDKLFEQIEDLQDRLQFEISEARELNDSQLLQELNKQSKEVDILLETSAKLATDDISDQKQQLEDAKRKIAQEIDYATQDKRSAQLKADYEAEKQWCQKVVSKHGDAQEEQILDGIIAQEIVTLTSSSPLKIQEKINELNNLAYSILFRVPDYLINLFERIQNSAADFKDKELAESQIQSGYVAIENGNFGRLREIINLLFEQLPREKQDEAKGRTGIV